MTTDSNTDQALIERYFDGTASTADKETFAAKMATDAAFRRQVHLHEGALRAVEVGERSQLKALLQKEHRQAFPDKRLRTTRGWLRWSLAAAAMLAGIIMARNVLFPAPPERASAIVERYVDWDGEAAERSGPLDVQRTERGKQPDSLRAFYQAVQEQRWRDVMLEYRRLPPQAEPDSLRFFSAKAMLKLGEQLPEALNIFDRIAQSRQSPLAFSAQWYYGLTLLALGRIEESRAVFTQINNYTDHPYARPAKEILDKKIEND